MAITFVQGTSATNSSGTSSPFAQSLSYGSNVTAGDLLIAAFSYGSQGTVNTVIDSQSNTWARADTAVNGTNNAAVDVWYAIAGSTGANTVTVHWTAQLTVGCFAIREYTGNASSSVLGNHTNATGSGTGATTTSISLSAGSLLFGAGAETSVALSVGSGFTSRESGGSTALLLTEDQVTVSPASIPVTFTSTLGLAWGIVGAEFKALGNNPLVTDTTAVSDTIQIQEVDLVNIQMVTLQGVKIIGF